MSERVGFVGLGNMGAACAEALLGKGYALTAWARREATVAPLRALGAQVAADLPALGRAADIVFICVTADADVRQVLAPDTLLAGLAPGSAAVILSTISPGACRELAELAARTGVAVIDAPVTGGAARALAGDLTVMVGGDRATYERCLPAMRAFGSRVDYLGEIGAGQAAKLLNNFVFSANALAAHEAFAMAARLGVDGEALRGVLATGSGASFALNSVPAVLQPGARGAMLIHKDAGLLQDLLAAAGGASAWLDAVHAALTPLAGESHG